MIPGLAIAAVVAVGAWLLFLRDRGVGDDLSDASSREDLARRVRDRQDVGEGGRDVLLGLSESDLAAGFALGAGGAAIAGAILAGGGPLGAFIGFSVGVFAAEVAAAIAHESYGEVVRGALKEWLRAEDYPATDANVDALLYREALLTCSLVYRHRDGRIAVQQRHPPDAGGLSLFGSVADVGRKNIPGPAASQLHQMIARVAPGQLDGESQRRRQRRWEGDTVEGGLYPLEFGDAPSSWRTPGYVWFRAKWPIVSATPIAVTRDWTRITPNADNVDELAAPYDRARGASWERS